MEKTKPQNYDQNYSSGHGQWILIHSRNLKKSRKYVFDVTSVGQRLRHYGHKSLLRVQAPFSFMRNLGFAKCISSYSS